MMNLIMYVVLSAWLAAVASSLLRGQVIDEKFWTIPGIVFGALLLLNHRYGNGDGEPPKNTPPRSDTLDKDDHPGPGATS